MRKLFILVVALLWIPFQASAQKIVYGNRLVVSGPYQCSPVATARDSAGNFYTTGTSEGQVYTEKKTPTGAVIYTHFFSDPPLSTGNPLFLAVNSAGDAFVAGTISNAETGYEAGVMLYCVSTGGSTVWSIKDGTHFNVAGLVMGGDGNPIVALARQKGSDSGIRNFDLIKYSAGAGAVVWKTLQSLNNLNTSCTGLAAANGHVYAIVFQQPTINTQVQDAVAYSDTTGKTLWLKPYNTYSTITDLTPRYFSVLPSGDFLVTGVGTGYTTGGWTVATFDRYKSTDGTFVFRKVVGPMSGGDTYLSLSTPKTDSVGNIYWAGLYRNGTTQASKPLAGKLNALGVSDFLTSLPAGVNGAGNHGEAVPGPNGEEFVETIPDGLVEISGVTSQGAIVYTRTIPVQFPTFGYPVNLYIDGSANPSVVGGSYDALGDSINRLVTLTGATGAIKIDSRTTSTGQIYNYFNLAAADKAGNIYVAGAAGLFCDVCKYSPSGALLWTKQINPTLAAWSGLPLAISWSPRGELVVAAEVSSYNLSAINLGVIKLDAADGDVIWSVTRALTNANYSPLYVQEDSVGGVVVAGNEMNNSTYTQEGIASKFAPANGAFEWEHLDPAVSYYSGMAIDGQGSVILTGVNNVTSTNQYEIKKYNSAGTLVYSHVLTSTTPNASDLSALAIDSQGNAYEACFDEGEVFLYRYGPTGTGGLLKSYSVPVASQFDCELIFDVPHNALYLMLTDEPGQSNFTTITMRIVPTTGALVWTDNYQRGAVIYNPSLGQSYMQWDVDKFGNVVLAGLSTLAADHPSDIIIRKLRYATGTPRYTYNYGGPYASSQDFLGGVVAAGSDGLPVIFGSAPSPFGPGSSQGLIAKIADTTAPICYNDSYVVKSGAILSAAAPGVLTNDEDALGATVALVTGPAHKSAFSLTTSGAFSYKASAGFKGTDTFTYKATTAYGVSNVATVVITVE